MGIKQVIRAVSDIVELLIPISIGIAVLVFFWGLVTYISKSAEVQGKQEGRNKMIWGIVVIFVMVSVWGLVRFMQQQLNILNTAVPGQPDNFPGDGSSNPPGGGGGGTNPPGGGGNLPPCGPFSELGLPCE